MARSAPPAPEPAEGEDGITFELDSEIREMAIEEILVGIDPGRRRKPGQPHRSRRRIASRLRPHGRPPGRGSPRRPTLSRRKSARPGRSGSRAPPQAGDPLQSGSGDRVVTRRPHRPGWGADRSPSAVGMRHGRRNALPILSTYVSYSCDPSLRPPQLSLGTGIAWFADPALVAGRLMH